MRYLSCIAFSIFLSVFRGNVSAQEIRTFPQKEINSFSASLLLQSKDYETSFEQGKSPASPDHSPLNILGKLHLQNWFIRTAPFETDTINLGDTLIIGYSPGDTLLITGNWAHTGPVVVLGDGVLIFDNADATIVGDIIVLGNGKIISDSSSFFIPQQYWYQRSIIVVQNGFMDFSNTVFNFGGNPHGFSASDSATVILNNITNNDYTTTGLSKNATITINGNNLTGEFIISDRCNLSLKNVNNALLWHQFPDSAVVNHSFPNGNQVNSYLFNNTIPGVSGIEYFVSVDTSTNVHWALMPTGGSDITISNSSIRSIGVWFEGSDTINVSGLVNNSNYSNFTTPLPDRNLHFINTSVQTWSLYLFDTAVVNVSGCIIGEVGTLGHSKLQGTNYWIDGSGGYCFATDTTFLFNGFSTVSSHVRSERSALQMFAYSTQSNGEPSAIGSSVLIVVQSTLATDPVPYEKSCVWLANISQLPNACVDSFIPVTGSAWIDKTISSQWMDFGSSLLWFQKSGDSTWSAVNNSNSQEVRNNTLALWNTNGLDPGSYNLRLVLYDDWGDSVEAIKSVNLLPEILISANRLENEISPLEIFPNPAKNLFTLQIPNWEEFQLKKAEIKIYNLAGQEVFSSSITVPKTEFHTDLPAGIYTLQIKNLKFTLTKKLEIIR